MHRELFDEYRFQKDVGGWQVEGRYKGKDAFDWKTEKTPTQIHLKEESIPQKFIR